MSRKVLEELIKNTTKVRKEDLIKILLNLPSGVKDLIGDAITNEHLYSPVDGEVGALYLSAGTGDRAPGSRKGPGYIRAKSAITIFNRPLIKWQAEMLRSIGIDSLIIVGRYKENRQQTKKIVNYGELDNLKIRYMPASFDLENTGSADSVRNALLYSRKYFPEFVKKFMLIYPCDEFQDINLSAMKYVHKNTNAIVTISTADVEANSIANTYGWILKDHENESLVKRFIEKPSLEMMADILGHSIEHLSEKPEPISAGSYLITTEEFLDITTSRAFKELYKRLETEHDEKIARNEPSEFKGIDFGNHFIPWLLERGSVIASKSLNKRGDLGNTRKYIDTMETILDHKFRIVDQIGIGELYDPVNKVWADRETLDWEYDGMSLRQRIENGHINIRNASLGKFVMINATEKNPVVIEYSDIGDQAEIMDGTVIRSSHVGRFSYIGRNAVLEQIYMGVEGRVYDSSAKDPTKIRKWATLSDEVHVYPGVKLEHGQRIGPKLHITLDYKIPPHAKVNDSADLDIHKVKA